MVKVLRGFWFGEVVRGQKDAWVVRSLVCPKDIFFQKHAFKHIYTLYDFVSSCRLYFFIYLWQIRVVSEFLGLGGNDWPVLTFFRQKTCQMLENQA